MEQQDLDYFKRELVRKKSDLEGQLGRLAKENPAIEGDYVTKFNPTGEDLEDEATDTESFINDVPVEHELEKTLKQVNEALERIEAGTYGISLGSGEEIPIDRLKAIPETPYTVEDEEAYQKKQH